MSRDFENYEHYEHFEKALDELAARIDVVALRPDMVKRPFTKLVARILVALDWRPVLAIHETTALVELMRVAPKAEEARVKRIELALDELDANVTAVERACVTRGEPPTAYATSLRRMLEVIARCVRAREPLGLRLAGQIDTNVLLPPLRLTAEGEDGRTPSQVRLLELQLASIDHLLDAAHAEPALLARRRRLLEAARQLLLETAAALPLEGQGVEQRQNAIASEILRLDRYEALGLSADVGLLHQARSAASRGDRAKLHAAVAALDELAVSRGDAEIAARTGPILDGIWQGIDRTSRDARAYSLQASAHDAFGSRALRAVADGYAAARARSLPADPNIAATVRAYLAPGQERATLAAALAVDGCFEVGGVMLPTRVVDEESKKSVVRFPTADLLIVPAESPVDIPDAIFGDPRTVLLDLAAGKLLARRFVHEERIEKPRNTLRGDVRIFLLDGSTSMLGARARLRDALMVAELSTLMRRLDQHGRTARLSLFYRYFTDWLGPTYRIDSGASALAGIADVLANVHSGGTDIETALVASFAQVREARAADPDLARAQIVVVTDGNAPVREALVEEARAGLESIPIALSVIALGAENHALRSIVARQRARGERAFYHFISDASLVAICAGSLERGAALHLPPIPPSRAASSAEAQRQLDELSSALLDDLAMLERTRDIAAIEALEVERVARHRTEAETGTALAPITEGERARAEALLKDGAALERRFARWFPRRVAGVPGAIGAASATSFVMPEEGTRERDDIDAVALALATLAEAVAVTGGSPLSRRADAIEILERLLPDVGVTSWRYEEVLRLGAVGVERGIAGVLQSVG